MPRTWIEDLIPLPRPEYAKQTEALLTDLLWRSDGSSLAMPPQPVIESLPDLRGPQDDPSLPDPERLVPRIVGSRSKVRETLPLAESFELATVASFSAGTSSPIVPLLASLAAPKARGDKSSACVPIHPATVVLQTLHGLVNKSSPANLARAIESMGWMGGASDEGAVARSFLALFADPADPKHGATGAIESLLPKVAAHVWSQLPAVYAKPAGTLPSWPTVGPSTTVIPRSASLLAAFKRTPFVWFWCKWRDLCHRDNQWHDRLPARRFADWALCLLRTGLAFSYLWEAEFLSRLHEMIASRLPGTPPIGNRIRLLHEEPAVLAIIERSTVPARQKGIWPATAELIARGWQVRERVIDAGGAQLPSNPLLADAIEAWVNGLATAQVESIGAPIRVTSKMANNQKEFVRYLLLPRSSDDDSLDQADFYSLARTNGKHLWFRPGPEWLVVITSLLCKQPGGACTLGELNDDLASLGVRVERPVLVGMLEEAGLSSDSPDADDALVLRSGF